MAEYINIKGTNVETVTSDPANPTVGQIWYNSTSNTLKGSVYAAAAWSSGANMPQTISQGGSAGTVGAALSFGGGTPPFSPAIAQTLNIEYNGTAWTALSGLPAARYQHAGFGSSTAAIAASGENVSNAGVTSADSWNGSSWTATGSVSEQVNQSGGTGTQAAGFIAGGYNPPKAPVGTANTQEYNGSTWALGGSLPAGRYAAGAAGPQTAGIMFGGFPTYGAIVNYDGATWTTNAATLGTPTAYTQGQVHGSDLDAAVMSGYDGSNGTKLTQFWDGTSISAGPLMALERLRAGSTKTGATSSGMYAFGGGDVPNTQFNQTEEYTGAGPSTVTVTSS